MFEKMDELLKKLNEYPPFDFKGAFVIFRDKNALLL